MLPSCSLPLLHPTPAIFPPSPQLLEAIKPLKRGLNASEEDQQRIDRLARALERRNPTKKPLASDLLSGQWELLYTTSGSILGANRPALLRPTGPTYQVIDTATLTARNKEGPPFFNQVSAELIPQNDRSVKARKGVLFKEFKILGLIPVKAPANAAGALEVTYLDEDLRVSRGDKGNLFVLRMQNRRVKP
ncbi:hypothetical protein COHA_005497 [Chlorella ohadii]|uniref:Plastid lipid-associated protein/fibrillin conserved domain-containing protein n=1 Tax=Chlorella ohadii TaxID=2649997 RepID=A0AAD5DQQ0_9CHLO|nr:hypothetical protein COHA_005497 [Chlorella ohadii]